MSCSPSSCPLLQREPLTYPSQSLWLEDMSGIGILSSGSSFVLDLLHGHLQSIFSDFLKLEGRALALKHPPGCGCLEDTHITQPAAAFQALAEEGEREQEGSTLLKEVKI